MTLTKVTHSMIGDTTYVFPEMFGAPMVGLGDDTVAYQAAVNYCIANKTELWHRRFYDVDRINVTDGITIRMGIGRGIRPRGANICLLCQPASGQPQKNKLSLLYVHIDGNKKGQLDAGVIQINGMRSVYIENPIIEDCGDPASGVAPAGVNGISISTFGYPSGEVSEDITVIGGVATRCTKAPLNITTDAERVSVFGFKSYANTGNGETPGIQINGASYVDLTGTHAWGNEGRGIVIGVAGNTPVRTSSQIVVVGGSTANNGLEGLFVGDGFGATTDFDFSIIGHIATGNGTSSNASNFKLENCNRVNVSSCISSSAYGHGLAAQNVNGMKIANSTFADGSSGSSGVYSHLAFVGCSFIDISNNTFRDSASRVRHMVLFDTGNSRARIFDNDTDGRWTVSAIEIPASGISDFEVDQILPIATDGTNYANTQLIRLADNQVLRAQVDAVGVGASNAATYSIANSYVKRAGTTAEIGATTAIEVKETSGTWDCANTISSNVVIQRVFSNEAAKWNVRLRLSCKTA